MTDKERSILLNAVKNCAELARKEPKYMSYTDTYQVVYDLAYGLLRAENGDEYADQILQEIDTEYGPD